MEPEDSKKITQIIQKTTCTFFCCFKVKNPTPKPKNQYETIVKKKKNKRTSALRHLPKLKISDLSQPKGQEEVKLPPKMPPLSLKKSSQNALNTPYEGDYTPGYTPMKCSTQNIFSFKDKEYQKQQEANMKVYKQFFKPSESRNSDESSFYYEGTDPLRETAKLKGEDNPFLVTSLLNTPSKNQDCLPKITDRSEAAPTKTHDLINDAENCIKKLDNLFEKQSISVFAEDSVSDATKSKSDRARKKVKRNIKKKNRKRKENKPKKEEETEEKKPEPSYNFNFWKHQAFAPAGGSAGSDNHQEMIKNYKPASKKESDESFDMYDSFAINILDNKP
ncbi:unnamed protein product [Moneuplotes crassus]|uniref:Uncharacterized protein n=1 Tax=Euplotes crassus TaxID=5936 RepID=A0AAD1U942_EUPCR|nr:unnamed protein product [Moneuplotes crassus]